jgi:hypothetical protein
VLHRSESANPLPRPLHSWSLALDAFFATHNDPNRRQTEAVAHLKIQYTLATIFLSASRRGSEMVYDHFSAEFAKVVSLAAELATKSALSCYTGVVPALYLTGIKCRNREIRREALEMLAKWRIREGLWQSAVVAKVIEEVIAMEEAGMDDGVVPEDARVSSTWLTFSAIESRSAMLKLESARYGKRTKQVGW